MLPYTPLHHLLLAELGFPVVATSGNRTDEPICIDEHEALARLAGIAELFLVHDRPIVRPVDDSVVRVIAGAPTVFRRARGLRAGGCGARRQAGHPRGRRPPQDHGGAQPAAGVVLGQHLGDLDTAEARDAYDRGIADIQRLHDAAPRLVARDLHPDYHSTRVAEALAAPKVAVQHHLAHVAACMAEHGLEPPVLGVSWDGTGYGTDGTVWGGEFLLVTRDGWRRVGAPAPVPAARRRGGGARAAPLGARPAPCRLRRRRLRHDRPRAGRRLHAKPSGGCSPPMLERGVNAPVTTSAGRLFDAVAALIGLRQTTSYEGQAAMELEWAATEAESRDHEKIGAYRLGIKDESGVLVLDWQPLVEALVADIRAGIAPAELAAAHFTTAWRCHRRGRGQNR